MPKSSIIALTLIFKDAKRQEGEVEPKVPVSTTAPEGKTGSVAPSAGHKH